MAISTVGSTVVLTTFATPVAGELTSIAFSGISCAEIDTSNLSKQVKSYVLGTRDAGTITLTCNFDQAPDMPVAGNATPILINVFLGDSGASHINIQAYGFLQSMAIETGIDAVISVTYVFQVNTVTIT